MNTSETQEAAFGLTDALGPDFVELAPPGEGHWDSVAVAEHISYGLMTVVGLGIADGVKEWTKTKTVKLLDAVNAEVGERLPQFIRSTFSKIHTPQVQRAALEDAATSMHLAQDATQLLDKALVDALISTSATSVRGALEQQGLNARSAERVEVTLKQTLSMSFRTSGNSDTV